MEKDEKDRDLESQNPKKRKGPQKDKHVNQYGDKNEKVDKENLEEDK